MHNLPRKWLGRAVAVTAVALSAAVLFTACGQTGQKGNTGSPAAQPGGAAPAGVETIYKNNCMSCHGQNLEGRVGPDLRKIGDKYDRAQIAAVIRDGRGGMPSFKGRLSDAQIDELAGWLADKK
ncbi:MAG: hypothetical protein BLM47_11280 [Candidatus Reconcilbacillus cellulovorans]|uniref:Cytochrome c domain-containing protein n=1 Tax=Candidatus Reconcilbacillus cellulovorans TaxID=1906605 RepID=A0A2A6DYQ0_9BACL|nr:MAG: hypothetical protein BLM47_11280 [Candidatus Reconcilbacillus cellulovorans]